MASTSAMVTILFTDLVGSTEINARIGDVAADELRRLHFEDLREAIGATRGTEVKTIGDAIMASYSGAADALNGAVEMQRAVARRNRRAAGQELHMRVGVSAGDATFEDGDWFGTPVVEAARLCAAATPDQILISDLVNALAGSRVEHVVRSLGAQTLKGLSSSINVSEVEWLALDSSGDVPLPGFVDTAPRFPFAGRASEFETLRTAWKDAMEAHRRVVLISGEPGIGKTRLVTEFVRTAHADGGVVVWGRCDEELDVPYQPFAEAIGQFIATISDERLRNEIAPFAAEVSKLVPDLARRLPGIQIVPVGDADSERHRLFESVADLFAAMASANPIVLVLDDIHWADKPSLLMLRHLLRRPTPIPLLVLGTYRDTDLDRSHPLSDVLADLRREPGVERVDLRGLDIAEITSFMELAAGHDLEAPALELARAIHRETEGNAFFLCEMIRHLAESGSIVQRDGRWMSDYSLEDVGIPEGIREVIGRRLSTLSSTVNAVLTIAAVIGPEFDQSTIAAADGPSGDALFDALDAAVTASVIREVKGTYGRYAFAHALVRSTLYEELSTNRRVRLHWRVAEAIAARYADSPEHLDQLAHHFAEGALAGDPLMAVDYCVRAAHRAADELAFEAATSNYDRALGALELVDSPDLALRADIEIARAESLHDSGNPEHQAAGLAAVATARRMGDPQRMGRATVAMARVPEMATIDTERVALVRDALQGIGDRPTHLRAQLLIMLATELYWGPHTEERIALGNEALQIAREIGDAQILSAVLAQGWTLFDGTQPFARGMLSHAEEALALAKSGTHSYLEALGGVLTGSAVVGDTDRAEAMLELLQRSASGARLSRFIWRAQTHAAMLAILAGDIDSAERAADDALAYANSHGVPATTAMSMYAPTMYNIRRAQGRVGELVPILRSMMESQPAAPVWRIALAGACGMAGLIADAKEQFEWLVADGFARVPHDVEYPVTFCGLARVAPMVDADADVCERVYQALLPFAGTMNFTGTSIADANDIGLACVADQIGWSEIADGHFREAIALAERARALPYEIHYRYEWARAFERRGDIAPARELATTVMTKAEGRGMDGPDGIVARTVELLARTA